MSFVVTLFAKHVLQLLYIIAQSIESVSIWNSRPIPIITSVRKFLERRNKHVSTPMFTLKSSLYPENKSLSNTNTFCGEIVTLRTPSLTSLHT
jgi:hypothetical protein